ncbi:hypothetical protein BC834DRAFT_1031605 [Gloeopeniophorella convolvens]|nr:hypothetical protein BC834DRAFT_1031605 [Gloeopeniophorella convolvens]
MVMSLPAAPSHRTTTQELHDAQRDAITAAGPSTGGRANPPGKATGPRPRPLTESLTALTMASVSSIGNPRPARDTGAEGTLAKRRRPADDDVGAPSISARAPLSRARRATAKAAAGARPRNKEKELAPRGESERGRRERENELGAPEKPAEKRIPEGLAEAVSPLLRLPTTLSAPRAMEDAAGGGIMSTGGLGLDADADAQAAAHHPQSVLDGTGGRLCTGSRRSCWLIDPGAMDKPPRGAGRKECD